MYQRVLSLLACALGYEALLIPGLVGGKDDHASSRWTWVVVVEAIRIIVLRAPGRIL